ncbi:MAG: tRNA (adenosine(37)-N6)-threonylcarbamoyltransferase complex ATPase subunit type 1 TsaE [Puia sp.]|nr:tRNA (adenosine(37)-N6)-threonylcarbamoyltransferase complex ATPase subunit type 1 TsaE [Puia sp.]
MEWSFDLPGIGQTAKDFWAAAGQNKVFAIHGEMGAGKTTFIHALCDELGVTSQVGSPTFSIINQYDYPRGRVFHIDLYRLNNEEEAFRAGVEEVLYSGEICLVEWPEKAAAILPPRTADVFIEVTGPLTRTIRLKSNLKL